MNTSSRVLVRVDDQTLTPMVACSQGRRFLTFLGSEVVLSMLESRFRANRVVYLVQNGFDSAIVAAGQEFTIREPLDL